MAIIEYPNYNESLVSLASSILSFYGVDNPGHPSLPQIDSLLAQKKPRNIVLMLFDGFGYNIMRRNLPADSFLARHIVMSFSSTFPPTTVAATTALRSGKTPIETGWLGWFSYYKEINEVVTTFTSHRFYDDSYVGQDLAAKYIPYTPIGVRIGNANPDVLYSELAPFSKFRIGSLSKMESSLTTLLPNGKRNYVYCYWPDPDRTMHDCGVNHPKSIETERYIDSFVESLTGKFSDTIFLIVADHGLIDARYVYLSDYPRLLSMLKRPFSIEPRSATFFVKDGMVESFKKEFEESLGDHFILMDRNELFESGLLGLGTPHPMVDEFMGDFIAIAKDDSCLSMERHDNELIGVHAGLTQDEMLVPLVVVDRT